MSLEIDIDKIIREKKPDLEKKLPRFLIEYLKRIVHQDEINDILARFGHLERSEFIEAVLDEWSIRREVIGLDGLHPSGRYVFVSNHPLGGLDGLILASELEQKFGRVRVIVNDLLMYITPIRDMFVPVNKYGRQNSAYARALNEAYESDVPILLFPASDCSRKRKFKIQDKPWKKSFVTKAFSSKRDVVPVYVEARNSHFFYNLSLIRTLLGIKQSIEMLYLPDEMFHQKGKRIGIVFGQPIPYTAFNREKTKSEWAQWVRTKAYRLKKQVK